MMKISALNEAPRARPETDDEDVQTISKEAQVTKFLSVRDIFFYPTDRA